MCCICPELPASSDPWLFAVASSLHLIAYLVGLSLLCALRRHLLSLAIACMEVTVRLQLPCVWRLGEHVSPCWRRCRHFCSVVLIGPDALCMESHLRYSLCLCQIGKRNIAVNTPEEVLCISGRNTTCLDRVWEGLVQGLIILIRHI